jgi:eukaryotic-like serine/threonine-protein kinase
MAGRVFSHYRILERIGSGGMSVVYKARDVKLDRLVAMKFLTPHLAADDVAVSRFLQEARAISALNHPHIATIHDLGRWKGEIFLVLEYLPGGTLRSLVRSMAAKGRRLSQQRLSSWPARSPKGSPMRTGTESSTGTSKRTT